MTNDVPDYTALADELDVLGQGTPQWAMPEAIGAGADAIRDLQERLANVTPPLETPQYAKLLQENNRLRAQVRSVRESVTGWPEEATFTRGHVLYALGDDS